MNKKSSNPPKRHHYVPQFFLRNFAVDPEKTKITALIKHGNRAVWKEQSIKSIAFEPELYVHRDGSAPLSFETKINTDLEDPISKTETWQKISEGATDKLDRSDRAVLYSLVRNLAARTPHSRNTARELAVLASQPDNGMAFSDDEKEMYAALRADPKLMSLMVMKMASSLAWTESEFSSCAISIWRVSNPVFVCSTPVHIMKSLNHPSLRATQAGLDPHIYLMPLTSRAYVSVSLGDFDGAFTNHHVDPIVEAGLKRNIVAQFSYWPIVRHMICPADGLVEQMEWAGYDCADDSPKKKTFLRNSNFREHQSV